MQNVFTIDADIKLKMLINEPAVVQNDTIRFIINVFDNGQPLDLTNVETVSLASVRLDRQTVVTPGTKIGTNTVQFDLGTEETKFPGRVGAIAQFYGSKGRVSTISFSYRVIKDPTGDGYIPSEREQTLIEVVLNNGPLVIQQARDAANFANEQGQFAQTQANAASEAAANANEAAQSAANAANEANTAATSANNAAASANDAANNANVAADNANNAANNANTQATNAQNAAQAANTATTNANNAASNANTKATYAQQQGDYAKTQGDYAKEQGDYAKSQAELIDEKASSEDLMQLQQEFMSHSADNVSKGEVHGLRITDGKLEYFNGLGWRRVKATPIETKVYGLEWNQTLDTYQRLEDAVDMVAITQGQNDFDNVYPWSKMKRCNLDDNANVLAYFGDPTYKDDGSNGQVMVQIPKFWYKSEMINEGEQKKYRWWIADNELEGFKLHPAFIRNGVEKDFIYIGAYEGYENGGKLHSIAGVMPTVNKNIVQFRSLAQARGSKWFQQDFLTTCAIQLLYLIEYAHFDSQTKIGQGITSASAYHQTGETAQYGNQSYGDPNNATVAMSYRGIENLYGNFYKWVDGINFLGRQFYVADHNFESDKFDGHYENLGIVLPYANGFVKDIHHTQMFDYGFLSSDPTGSSASYIPDQQYTNYAGARVARFGGARSNESTAGAFCWSFDSSSSASHSSIGTRLLCIP